MSKNIGNYRNDADFEIKVGEGVYWVPVCSLGKTRYTNAEMSAFLELTPEEKRERIGNLYEAVQLFQLSRFEGVFDNDDRFVDGWQCSKHTAPRDAVANNRGCCATDTNWLMWFLDGKYDHVGALSYGQRDGNGHVISHFAHEGKHYFIDMMMARVDSGDFFRVKERRMMNGKQRSGRDFCTDVIRLCALRDSRTKNSEKREDPPRFSTACAIRSRGHSLKLNISGTKSESLPFRRRTVRP